MQDTEQQIDRYTNHLYENAVGYGLSESNDPEGKAKLRECVASIPAELRADFFYTMSRIAEKSGEEGFEPDF